MKTFTITVTGTKFDTYEIEADSEDDAEKQARQQFRDDHESGSHIFDGIETVVEDDDDEE
jgi:hypothetical protein